MIFSLFCGQNDGLSFVDGLLGLLGFKGFHEGSRYHIGYKMLETFEKLTTADDKEKFLSVIIPLTFQHISIYVIMIEYQYVGYAKASS